MSNRKYLDEHIKKLLTLLMIVPWCKAAAEEYDIKPAKLINGNISLAAFIKLLHFLSIELGYRCGFGEEIGPRESIVLELPWEIIDGVVTISDKKTKYAMLAHELIGDLSQDVDLTSYNEFTVREWWRKGTLNEVVTDARATHMTHPDVFLNNYPLKDGDYQSLLTFLIKQNNGWPVSWGTELSCLGKLSKVEQKMVDEFDEVEYIKRQHEQVK